MVPLIWFFLIISQFLSHPYTPAPQSKSFLYNHKLFYYYSFYCVPEMDAVSQYLKVHSRFVTEQSWIISVYAGTQAVFILLLASKAEIALSAASWSHSWWVSSALQLSKSMPCCLPAWAAISWPTSGQGCAVAIHKCTNICYGLDQSQASASISCRGQKPFLLHKGTGTGREAGAVAQRKSALEIKTLLQWWLISLHNSPLDVLDTNMLFLM